jgi:hypothetical protein
VTVPYTIVQIKRATTPFVTVCNDSKLRLPIMQNERLLMLQWLSFSWCGREHADKSVTYTGCHYSDYVEWLVLAMCPGNSSAVMVLTGGLVWFGFRPSQKPDLLCHGRFVTQTGHRTAGIWPGWDRTAVPNIRFLPLYLQLGIWVLIISWHSQYVNHSALATISPPAFKFAIRLIFVEWLLNHGCG